MSESAGRHATTVREQPLGDELSLFDAATGRALALNRTARDVWSLVDGEATSQQIVAALATAYAVEPEVIADDVALALGELRSAGVVVDSGP
ncbi:MAG TPA: PqqD family protein [Blastococcus sp.]|nr:PqqD family protein [Blastococcus sp.]